MNTDRTAGNNENSAPERQSLSTKKTGKGLGARREEQNILNLLRRNDPEGLKAMMQRYNDKLFAVANRISNNPADSEEILQDVYMTAINNIDRFQERSALSTWLYRITVNAALMKLRSDRFKKSTVPMDDAGFMLPEETTLDKFDESSRPPDKSLMSKELYEQVIESAETLPEIYRKVFFLRDLKGFSIKETSSMLETTPAAIKSRLHRGRSLIRETLKPYMCEN